MCHHDGWIKGGEIESRNWVFVKTSCRLNDDGTLILSSILVMALDWNKQVVVASFSIEL